jgi:hypothetical protein
MSALLDRRHQISVVTVSHDQNQLPRIPALIRMHEEIFKAA